MRRLPLLSTAKPAKKDKKQTRTVKAKKEKTKKEKPRNEKTFPH
jgi:hypothetical protein